MKKTVLLLLTVLFQIIPVSHAQNFWQKGNDINGEATYDISGWSVSMPDARTVAIGGRGNDGNGLNSGHVRVYRWNSSFAGTWEQKGNDIDGEAAEDFSGWSVSMPDSNTVGIGATENGNSRGHVRVYRWTGNSWVQKGNDLNGEAEGDQSGYSVSMPDSNTVAIGARFNGGAGPNTGHVRIYNWNGNAWMQKGIDLDGVGGFSVSMPDNNTIAIGAGSNIVKMYRWNGSAWLQKGNDIIGEENLDGAGRSVSMPDSNTIAIGAQFNDGNGFNAGHVRIYSWNPTNGGAWIQKGSDIDGEAGWDESGRSVSMPDSNTVAIGASLNNASGTDVGHIRVYRWNGNAWVQKGSDINGENSYNEFGRSVSMPDSNTVAGGSILNDGSAIDAGHTRVYSFCSPTSSTIFMTACHSYTWPVNNVTYTTSTYTEAVLVNAASCDSTIKLYLTIEAELEINDDYSPQLVVEQTGGSNATYQWLDCDNNFAIIPGAIFHTFEAQVDGNYAVEVSENGCVDTSACVEVNGIGIIENTFGTAIKMYPNPTDGKVTIDLGSSHSDVIIIVRNTLGQELLKKLYGNSSALQLNIPGAAGVYFIEILSDDKKALVKVIKE